MNIMATVPVINYVIFFILLALVVYLVSIKWSLMESTINSSNESASQKRLTIFLCTLLLIVIALLIVLLNVTCPDYVWFGLLGLIGAGLGISAWEKTKMKSLGNDSKTTDTP